LQSTDLVRKGLIKPPKPVWRDAFAGQSPAQNPGPGSAGFHYHIYHQYVIATPRRNDLRAYLSDKGIGTEIYYPVPLHLQDCFQDLGYQEGSYPKSEEAARTTLALPIYPELTVEQQEYVVNSIGEFFATCYRG
jgi:dTDP-4-amino-4,6-dideoxygalactose transaminase